MSKDENKQNQKKEYVLNPETNHYILKGTALHKRLVKAGKVSEEQEYKQPAVVVQKKVKAVANINELSKTEIDDLYEQLKARRLQQEKTERRGRPIGSKIDPAKPTLKGSMGLLKPPVKPVAVKEPKFKVSVKPSKPKTDTEIDFTDED